MMRHALTVALAALTLTGTLGFSGGCGDSQGVADTGAGGGGASPPLGGGGNDADPTVTLNGTEGQTSGSGGAGGQPGGSGGGDVNDCAGSPASGSARVSFAGTVATEQYVESMLAAGHVPALLSLDYEDLRDALDDVTDDVTPNLSGARFDAWMEHPTEKGITLEVRTDVPNSSITLDTLAVLVDASPSTASIAELRRAVLVSLARRADAADVKLRVYAFSDASTLLAEPALGKAAEVVSDIAITPAEGNNLAKALSAVSVDLKDSAHVLVLTDAGFAPTEETLLQIGQMQRSEKAQRVSIAQLSKLEGSGSRTELRRSTLRPIAAAGQGFALFLSDRDVACEGAVCSHAAVEQGFDRWFATFAPAPSVQVLLPAGLEFVDAEPPPEDEPSTQPTKQHWVPSSGTLELSLPLTKQCIPSELVSVLGGEHSTSALVSSQGNTNARIGVDDRLRAIVAAMRSQTAEEPAESLCSALQALPPWSPPCGDQSPNTSPTVCAYATNVAAFHQRVKTALCLDAEN